MVRRYKRIKTPVIDKKEMEKDNKAIVDVDVVVVHEAVQK